MQPNFGVQIGLQPQIVGSNHQVSAAGYGKRLGETLHESQNNVFDDFSDCHGFRSPR